MFDASQNEVQAQHAQERIQLLELRLSRLEEKTGETALGFYQSGMGGAPGGGFSVSLTTFADVVDGNVAYRATGTARRVDRNGVDLGFDDIAWFNWVDKTVVNGARILLLTVDGDWVLGGVESCADLI